MQLVSRTVGACIGMILQMVSLLIRANGGCRRLTSACVSSAQASRLVVTRRGRHGHCSRLVLQGFQPSIIQVLRLLDFDVRFVQQILSLSEALPTAIL
jgi:hypothetical protein